jgi:hypothetical protein
VTGEPAPLHQGSTTMLRPANIRAECGRLLAVVVRARMVLPA